MSLYCDDFANEVNFGQTWQANLSKITTGSDLSQTRYGGVANAAVKYQEIAWLDTQFSTQATSQWGDIHATIWQVFDPTEAPTPSSSYWLQQAQQLYSTISYDSFRVVTNEGPVTRTGQVQEFITILPSNSSLNAVAAPEPATAVMMGSSFLMSVLGVRVLRRRQRAKVVPAKPSDA